MSTELLQPIIDTLNQSIGVIVAAILALLGAMATYYVKKAGSVVLGKIGAMADAKTFEADDRRKQFAVAALNGVIAAAVAQVNQTVTKRRGPDGKLALAEADRLKSLASKWVTDRLTPENKEMVIAYFGTIQDVLAYTSRRIEAEVYWQKPLKVARIEAGPMAVPKCNTEPGAPDA